MSSLVRPIVLLVEDSDDDAFFFRHALKRSGLTASLFRAADGAAALKYFEAAQASPQNATQPWPDLVFLDLKLPTFSGFEILSWIRERKMPALDITILSGSDHASDVERAASLGASGYLVKPIATDVLRTRLMDWSGKQGASAASPVERAN